MTFLICYNGIFIVTNRNNKFHLKKSLIDEDFFQTRIREGTYEIESLNDETKRNIIDEGHYTSNDYPFKIKTNFKTLGSVIEIHPQGPIIGFVFNDSFGNLLGFDETIF